MNNLEILELAGLRCDGRESSSIRPISINFEVNSTMDGSVYYQQGLNKILVNIVGPMESGMNRNDSMEKGSIEVNYRELPFWFF